MKFTAILAILFFIGGFKTAQASDVMRIKGRSISTAGNKQCLVESGGVIFDLDCQQLKKQSIQLTPYANVEIFIDRTAVKKMWSMYPTSTGKEVTWKAEKPEQRSDGRVLLTGSTVASFEDPFYLVEVSGAVYKIKKDLLSAATQKILSQSQAQVAVELPRKAIELAWTLTPASTTSESARGIASIPQKEGLTWSDHKAFLNGTVICSFEKSSMLVQAGDKFVRLELDKNDPEYGSCNKVGQEISVRVDPKRIKNVWETPRAYSTEEMSTAMLPGDE